MVIIKRWLPSGGSSELPITGGLKQRLANHIGSVEGIHHQGHTMICKVSSCSKNKCVYEVSEWGLDLMTYKFLGGISTFSVSLFVPLTLNCFLWNLDLSCTPGERQHKFFLELKGTMAGRFFFAFPRKIERIVHESGGASPPALSVSVALYRCPPPPQILNSSGQMSVNLWKA